MFSKVMVWERLQTTNLIQSRTSHTMCIQCDWSEINVVPWILFWSPNLLSNVHMYACTAFGRIVRNFRNIHRYSTYIYYIPTTTNTIKTNSKIDSWYSVNSEQHRYTVYARSIYLILRTKIVQISTPITDCVDRFLLFVLDVTWDVRCSAASA